MPRIIRQALVERLLKSPRAAAFLRDFSAASGIPVRFATLLGQEVPITGSQPEPAICQWMRSNPERSRLCNQTIQEGVLASARASGCGGLCAAGLREAAVPLRLGGEIFGYLLVGQIAVRPLDLAGLNRWRHALDRVGQRVPPEQLEALAASVEVMTEERFAAVVRLLEWSAAQIAGQMEDQLAAPVEQLSPPIRKAAAYIRSHFDEPLSLGAVAREVGMSREHFCTMFHKGTGLTFIDYLTRLRIERAGVLLRESDRTVTEIALACGFQSISHFNRRFLAIIGESPTAFRRRNKHS